MNAYGIKGGFTFTGLDPDRKLKIEPLGKDVYSISISGYPVVMSSSSIASIAKWILDDLEYRREKV